MRPSFDALRRRPGRSAMTVLGIGLASGLVVMLLALSAGVQTSASTLAYASGIDLLATSAGSGNQSVFGGAPPPVPGAHPLASQIPSADPNVAVASPWLLDNLVYGNASLWSRANGSNVPAGWSPTDSGTVGWIPDQTTGIEIPALQAGPGFDRPGDPYYNNGSYNGSPTHEIVLDEALAGVLDIGVGQTVWVAASGPSTNASLGSWYANATAFRVVGLSGPFWLVPSALLAFAYLSEVQALTGSASASTDYATLVLIHLHDPSRATDDQTILGRAFPTLAIFTLGDILGEIEHVVSVYRTFGTLVGAVGLVVAALFATTILQMSVDDRSRELALLRAVGTTRAGIGALVMEESFVVAGLGLLVGLPVGYLGSVALNGFLLGFLGGLPAGFSFVTFDAGVIAFGALAVLAVGLVAGALPAFRAMALPISEELRAP
jgi:putative ABC transport system permease protein